MRLEETRAILSVRGIVSVKPVPISSRHALGCAEQAIPATGVKAARVCEGIPRDA